MSNVLWYVTLRYLVDVYRRFRGTCCIHFWGLLCLKMEIACSSKMLLNICQTTQCEITEKSDLHIKFMSVLIYIHVLYTDLATCIGEKEAEWGKNKSYIMSRIIMSPKFLLLPKFNTVEPDKHKFSTNVISFFSKIL